MSFWASILAVAILLAQTASVVLAQCDDEPVPASPGSSELRPMSTSSAAIDTSFGSNGFARLTIAGHDRFMAVTVGPDGSIYGAGFITNDGDQAMAVAKLTPSGMVDASFGNGGLAVANVSVGKTAELARSITLLNDKILVAGPIERDVNAPGDAARDTDVAVVRFDMSGKLDSTWGQGGSPSSTSGPAGSPPARPSSATPRGAWARCAAAG
jgi:uncharacterized delta-60 repeat protein